MKDNDASGFCDMQPENKTVKTTSFQDQERDGSSSSESTLEVKLNEFVKKSELTNLDIRALAVKCSSCGRQVNHLHGKEMKKHRRLGVITCKECYDFYGSSEFSQDESGYNYCTWCGNGGKLIVCDFCPNGFCSSCVRRNFGRAEISVTTKEGWKCYCCNKKRLKPKIKFCDMLMEFQKTSPLTKEKKPAFHTPTFSEDWLQAAFDESEKACKLFHGKLSKLKTIGKKNSKSLKHIVSKLEQLIDNHRSDLRNTANQLLTQYTDYVNLKLKNEEQQCDSIEIIESESEKEKEINNKPVSYNNASEKTNFESEMNVSPHEEVENDISHKEKIKAKLSLLKSSSDSDVQDVHSSDLASVHNNLNNNNDLKDNSAEKNMHTLKMKAKRSLKFSSTSSCDSDTSSNKGQKVKHKGVRSHSVVEINIENDQKLICLPTVNLIPCDHLLPNGEISVKVVSDGDEKEEKLAKVIDSLCKFPIMKKNSSKDYSTASMKSKVKAVKKEESESSSSILLSSSEEEHNITIFKPSKSDLISAKQELLNSASSTNISSDLDSEEKDVKTKKSKKSAKPKSENSSDEFQPTKKRRYDKLLHAPLLSDEEKKPKNKSLKKKRKVLSSGEENKPGEKDTEKLSDTTGTSSDEENRKKSKKQSKKRRRIQTLDSSSEEKEAPSSASKGRKNIQRLISQENLAAATKEAQLEEKERRRRIQERQKLYNKIEDISTDGKIVTTKKMVLEIDQESKEEIVEIHPDLVCKLKPHQVNGVKFMWECTIESVKDLNKPGSGCILAHCMGLGKTLQVIAFLHTCLTNPHVSKVITKAMIICPYNTALNWAAEFDHWLSDVEGNVLVHQLTTLKNNYDRADVLRYWFEEGGVIIVSYDIFRRLAADKITKLKASFRTRVHKHLLDPGPDIVVCDEGHMLKNENSATFKATTKLKTQRRIVLTGTPLQNNLKEYHCMLSFVKPNLLGTSKEFRNRFAHPIMNGQYDDSNEFDVKIMKKRIHILHKLLEGCVQRCDYSALTKFLSPKLEFVISVKLSEIQIKMYQCYLEKVTDAKKDLKGSSRLFTDFNNLRCIWNHPYMYIKSHERMEYKKLFRDVSDEEFINDETDSAKSDSSNSESDDVKEVENDLRKVYKTRSRADEEVEEVEEEVKQWFHEFVSEDDKCNIELSGKMVLLMDILKECEAIGDKIIVFSQSLLALDAIEEIISYVSIQPPTELDRNRDVIGTWIKGLDYFRMDGTTSADFRKNYIDMFNNPQNLRARLFLISTRAGSLGTNLIGANRVVIFDTSWNPSHDVQAIFRVYRFGQTKPVYIYRLLAQGTMEEKIYDRQVTKLSLSYRVVDEQQIDRHFSAADLAELYTFDPNSTSNRPTPMVPKDRLLAELLIRNNEWIVTYHEHDSLLQNQTEEDLTEEERQAAWLEYENEREGRTEIPDVQLTKEGLTLGKEPDFQTMSDYDGKLVPDLNVIISVLYERLKTEMTGNPNSTEMKRKLLSCVGQVRQYFQEQHCKTLRKKQEFVGRGSPVPIAINKYLDELSQGLKSTGTYITKLQGVINQEDLKAAKFQEQVNRMQANIQNNFIRVTAPGVRLPGFIIRTGMRVAQPFVNIRLPNQGQRPVFFARSMPNPGHTYARTVSTPKPTITEVDDNAPPEPVATTTTTTTNSTNKSTVVIEEIS